MKMVMAVVPKEESGGVLDQLVANGQTATYMESRGGVLHQSRVTMYIAVEDNDLNSVLEIVRGYCHSGVMVEDADGDGCLPPGQPHTAEVGGAVVFVWELEGFHKY